MLRRTALLLALTLLIIAAAPVAAKDSLHVSRSVFTAEKHNQKHPATLIQTMTINQDVTGTRLCITYENTSKKSQGWGEVEILITRTDGTEETARLANQVGGNIFIKCTKADQVLDLAAGDTVLFEWEFQNMLRLRRKGDTIDHIIANGVVVADGFPLYVEQVGAMPGVEEDGKEGGWLHTANYNIKAKRKNQKHPKAVTKNLILAEGTAAPNVCILYRNSFNKAGKGTVKTSVSFYRGDEMFESLSFSKKVKKNKARLCKVGPDLLAGDLVVFDYTFNGLPRMNKKNDDYAEIVAAFSTNGKAVLVSPGDGPTPSDPGGGGGNTNPPPPSGGFTSDDLAAVAKVLYGGRPTQLWRPKAEWNETRWMIIGPGTQLGDDNGGINRATVGYGDTLAAAVADYERKRGKLQAASKGLSNADIDALKWYAAMSNSGGPTSIRMPRSSAIFVAEYFRAGRGVVHENFGSFVAAINFLRSQGL